MSAYAETSIRVIQKSLADLILNGEFSTEPVLSIAGEANTLSFDSLLPQVYHDKIDKVQKLEQTLKLEGLVGLSDTQKTKPEMTIQRLDNITDHKCILSGLINVIGLAAALFDMEQMEELQISPLIIQIVKVNLWTYRSHRTKLWIQACENTRASKNSVFLFLNSNLYSKKSKHSKMSKMLTIIIIASSTSDLSIVPVYHPVLIVPS